MRSMSGLEQAGQNFIRGATGSPCQRGRAMSIALRTFALFGTVLDGGRGLRGALGTPLSDDDFDRIVDRQGELEREAFRPYAEIVAQSLVDEAGLDPAAAARIGSEAGRWPLYGDSAEALQLLQKVAPCAAITNSDVAHGVQVQAQLGFRLDGWVCAEDVRAYKPDPQMWQAASRAFGVPLSPARRHASAYAPYALATA